MASGDGLLVRVRAGHRALGSAELRTLVDACEAHASGTLELTRRANLQLRGVRPERVQSLRDTLVAHGLVAASARAERQLGWLTVDPLGARAHASVAAVGHALARMLAHERLPESLSAKLALVVDGGSLPAVLRAELRLEVCGEQTRLWLALAETPGFTAHASLGKAVEHVRTLLLALGAHGGTRFSALDPRVHAHLRAQSGLVFAQAEPRVHPVSHTLGIAHTGEGRFVACAWPFGAAPAAGWRTLTQLADTLGDGNVLTTPARTLVIGTERENAQLLAAELARAGLVVNADDPRRAVVACVGAPACGSARGDTRALAARIARRLPPVGDRVLVHVSGCGKGCAHDGAAPLTVLCAGEEGVHSAVAGALAAAQGAESVPADAGALLHDAGLAALREPYERDASAIYARSFAIIRREAALARFSPLEERVAVRMIHTAGMVDLADDLVFTPSFAERARTAVQSGAPILCDATMIVSGVTRARLRAHNDLMCFLDHPSVPALARALGTTRSAAALELWRERLAGALVVIGNAPTALFRLLEILDDVDARPSAVIGVPVGFVGAAESKEALLADARVPALVVRGRRGGSALAVAAINALAQDEE